MTQREFPADERSTDATGDVARQAEARESAPTADAAEHGANSVARTRRTSPRKRRPLVTTTSSDAAVESPSAAELTQRGLRAREAVPIESLGVWAPAVDRPSPISLLKAQERARVQWLLPLRHGRMASSAFAFYRGAAKVMASDLASIPHTGLIAQLCGDAHLANFGVFGTPERRLVFDVNDFDETLPGPWEWDVKRLAASLVTAARERGFRKRDQRAVARVAAAKYREAMAAFSKAPAIEVYYASLTGQDILAIAADSASEKDLRLAKKQLQRAQQRTSAQVFERITETVDGRRQIKTEPPSLYDLEEIPRGTTRLENLEQAKQYLRAYRRSLPADRRRLLERYEVVDVALKVVGVGSVGTRCFVVLLVGMDEGDPLFLQVKQADPSVLEAHLVKSRYANHGERVVAGQRLMQAAGDIFLGWLPGARTRGFYIRQLKDWKGAADIGTMNLTRMSVYAGVCGWTLARAHARSGQPLEIASYIGDDETFDDAMVRFATVYADQNERDYAEFLGAIGRGELPTASG